MCKIWWNNWHLPGWWWVSVTHRNIIIIIIIPSQYYLPPKFPNQNLQFIFIELKEKKRERERRDKTCIVYVYTICERIIIRRKKNNIQQMHSFSGEPDSLFRTKITNKNHNTHAYAHIYMYIYLYVYTNWIGVYIHIMNERAQNSAFVKERWLYDER